ncbi:MAG: DUF1015 domain-containing protein [Clostridia bacterium]|nr:DUF1015 domain-containing protein [Clostridia bacterium]
MCFETADILIPEKERDKFAVIACDQFTSEPDYWNAVRDFTAGSPTALDLILPEIYLKDDNSAAIEKIQGNMEKYLARGVFSEVKDSFIFVRRVQSDGIIREGIIGKIDLKEYSYLPGANSCAIRATEKTVLERIPPRAEIRKGAALELPHVMLLFNDAENAVIGSLTAKTGELKKLYDFDLFGKAGHIEGYKVCGESADEVIRGLSRIRDKNNGLLFLVGDGNHSLAAAKSIYEQTGLEKDRYALVEIVNIHSPAINFEPIYRVCFGVNPAAVISDFEKNSGGAFCHEFRCVFAGGEKTVKIKSDYSLPVAALQNYLDNKAKGVKIDYIHGVESAEKIARRDENSLGFIFKGMEKSELFGAVINDGSLPRKTFSMGHALDKRFYFEARKIV